MTASFWLPFLVYVFISAFTPGPNNILSLSNAGTFGLRRSIPLLLGIGISFVGVMLLCGLATATLAELLPPVMPWVTGVGAAYILWLAWRLARSSAQSASVQARPCGFWHGFALQFVNIKVILYGLTSFTTFILPQTRDWTHLVGFALLLAGAGNAANWTWALAGELFQKAFAAHGRLINGILALLLAYSVLGMFV